MAQPFPGTESQVGGGKKADEKAEGKDWGREAQSEQPIKEIISHHHDDDAGWVNVPRRFFAVLPEARHSPIIAQGSPALRGSGWAADRSSFRRRLESG